MLPAGVTVHSTRMPLHAHARGALEADLGIPVISSNQAQLWTTLRAAGVFARISGWGRLLTT